jgi:hypothetical protein
MYKKFEEDSMSRKSHKNGKGIMILFLIALITLLGCPTGSATDPTDINNPDSPSGGSGGGGSKPGTPAENEGAAASATATKDWIDNTLLGTGKTNAPEGVKLVEPDSTNPSIVNVLQNLEVVETVTTLSLSLARAAGAPVYQIAKFAIPSGVTFSVPAEMTLTIAQGGEITVTQSQTVSGTKTKAAAITVAGSLDVQAPSGIKAKGPVTVASGGGILVSKGGGIDVDAGGKIAVSNGGDVKVDAGSTIALTAPSAAITVAPSAAITVAQNATIDVKAANATVTVQGKIESAGEIKVAAAAKVEVAGSGTLAVANGGTVTVAAASKGNAAGSITVASQAKIEVAAEAKVESAGKIEVTGKIDIKEGGTGATKELVVNSSDSIVVAGDSGLKVEESLVVNAPTLNDDAKKIELASNAEVTGNETVKEALAFVKVSETVAYASSGNVLSVTYVFSDALNDVPTATDGSTSTWSFGSLSNENKTVTATYSGNSGPVTLKFTAKSKTDNNKTVTISTSAYAVESAAFARNSETVYTVAYYGESTVGAIAGLTTSSQTKYYLLPTDDNYFKNLFNAIYTPNAPNSTDNLNESGKSAVAYNPEISAAILPLFSVTVGSEKSKDKVEIKGATLPVASVGSAGATAEKLIIIDIGVPGTVNSGLPTFYIPHKGLGTESTEYAYLRLRVNQGASLVILADNSGYITVGVKNSCPNGYFNNGCVEVMAGGELRDGAYEGFPLGKDAVILNHAGSYLSIGPEPGSDDAKNDKVKTVYDAYFAGYLIGPDGNPRIEWNNSTGYLEVRPGALAISGDVIVKKLMGLIYDAYFIGNTTVAIADGATLFPNDTDDDKYDFFGTSSQAKIVIQKGGVLSKGFLTAVDDDAAKFLKNTGTSSVTIQNNKSGGSGASGTYTTSISGTQNWDVPDSLTEGTMGAQGFEADED